MGIGDNRMTYNPYQCDKCGAETESDSENEVGQVLCDDCFELWSKSKACKNIARLEAEQDLTGQDLEAFY